MRSRSRTTTTAQRFDALLNEYRGMSDEQRKQNASEVFFACKPTLTRNVVFLCECQKVFGSIVDFKHSTTGKCMSLLEALTDGRISGIKCPKCDTQMALMNAIKIDA